MLRGLIHTGEAAQVRVDQIQVDGGTQMRAGLDGDTVQEYAEKMENGWGDFPSVVLFYDGTDYWLADGFHRLAAYKSLAAVGDTLIPADVRSGTRRDAILFAASANANHGLRRTKADKRRSVEVMLRDEEWQRWSNREIARRCAVDEKTVREIKRDLGIDTADYPQYTHPKTGQMTTMNTANIGAQRRYESGLPALNMPAPGAGLAKLPMTDWELGDVVESVVREYYGDVERGLADGFAEVLASAGAQAGGYWERLERALAPFAVTPTRVLAAVKVAVERMVAGRQALRPGSPEAKALSRQIKAETWGDRRVASRPAEVWEIEQALGAWAAQQPVDGLRTVARLRGGALWWEVRQVLQGLAPLTYRDRDLVQALNNVAAQREQAGARGEGRGATVAGTGREGEGEREVDPWVAAHKQGLSVLVGAILPWVRTWTDDKGRTWRDVVGRNPQHANSPFRQELNEECQRRGLMIGGVALVGVIVEVFSRLTAADERTADFADGAEGAAPAADGEKLLTEWTDDEWAAYAATGQIVGGKDVSGICDDVRAGAVDGDGDGADVGVDVDAGERGAVEVVGRGDGGVGSVAGVGGFREVVKGAAEGGGAGFGPSLVVAVDGRELPAWAREEERSVAMLPADMAGRWVIVSDGAGQVFLEDKAGKRSTERGGLEVFEELVDQARRMDASLVVASSKTGRLQGWLVRLLTLRSELVDWGELTGHHLETLTIGRELDKLVGMTQRELDMLTGTADVVAVDGEQEAW
jgi:hypothetical protein